MLERELEESVRKVKCCASTYLKEELAKLVAVATMVAMVTLYGYSWLL